MARAFYGEQANYACRARPLGAWQCPCTGAKSAIPHWTSTTVRPTGARLRVRCLRARGSIGAPSETADFKRSNGTGFDSRMGFGRQASLLAIDFGGIALAS